MGIRRGPVTGLDSVMLQSAPNRDNSAHPNQTVNESNKNDQQ
jgi:hypothetical protein